ncbi:MAG: anti-sigma factor family protein [Fidelibacterota bacterium]
MDRYQFEDLISEYIENNLSMSLRKEFETYLDDHPGAKEQIKSVKQIMESMKSLPIVKTSDSFTDNLYKRITVINEGKSTAKPTHTFAGYQPLMVGLSAVAIIAVLMLGIELAQPKTPQPAGFPSNMAEGKDYNNIPDVNRRAQDELLVENEDDSTDFNLQNSQKNGFEDQIQLVGDKRP